MSKKHIFIIIAVFVFILPVIILRACNNYKVYDEKMKLIEQSAVNFCEKEYNKKLFVKEVNFNFKSKNYDVTLYSETDESIFVICQINTGIVDKDGYYHVSEYLYRHGVNK